MYGWILCTAVLAHLPCLIGYPPGVAGIPHALGLTWLIQSVTCLLRTICMTHVLACAVHGYQAGGSRFSQTKSYKWFYRLFVDTSTSAWAVLLQVVSVYGVAYANSCLWVGCW
jgi:hypothetical protein